MNNEKLFEQSGSTIKRLERGVLLNHGKQRAPGKTGGKLQALLKKLAWLAVSATLLAALLTWGFNSRFGSLLLLLLR